MCPLLSSFAPFGVPSFDDDTDFSCFCTNPLRQWSRVRGSEDVTSDTGCPPRLVAAAAAAAAGRLNR